eukprot:COSAG02_NODE_1685_length_11320_cov_4.020408_8_plen_74_part_00
MERAKLHSRNARARGDGWRAKRAQARKRAARAPPRGMKFKQGELARRPSPNPSTVHVGPTSNYADTSTGTCQD